MRNNCKILCVLGLQLFSLACYADQIGVSSLRYSDTASLTRLLVDVTASPKHRVFVMDNPSRLVIDLQNARLVGKLSQPPASHSLFSHVRAGVKNTADLRIVIDLKKPLTAKTFSLSANDKDAHHLFVDLHDKETSALRVKDKAKAHVKSDDLTAVLRQLTENSTTAKAAKEMRQPEKTALGESKANKIKKAAVKKSKTIVVAIDAGHGGSDPGAQGVNGTEEKQITFAIAQKLADLVNGQAGMKAIMVRKSDDYIGLRERMQIARAAKANVFISIHADAFKDSDVRGASVYTLSRSGASSEAAHWLAKSENAVDLIGGVSLGDKERDLKTVLLNLSQTATEEASVNIADNILKSVQNVGDMHKISVQKAEFAVLKSPDIPSILVETAFISNPAEELNLMSPRYQTKMATAIFKGVKEYFKRTTVVSSRIASL